MDNIKGYEMYTSSEKQIQFFYSTFWYVPCKKRKRQQICSYFTTGEVSVGTLHYDKDVAKLDSV